MRWSGFGPSGGRPGPDHRPADRRGYRSFSLGGFFQRRIESVLELQSEIARAIAAGIAVKVSPEEESRLAAAREVDPATYEAYLRGMHHLKKGSPEGFEKGMKYLHQAVDIDPADPLAYAGLANGYVTLGHTSGSAESFKRAKAAARRAFEIDPSLAEAQAALAEVAMYFDWDWDAAELAFQKAIELSPSHAEVHAHYTWLHVLRGDWEEAIAEARLAQELDPWRRHSHRGSASSTGLPAATRTRWSRPSRPSSSIPAGLGPWAIGAGLIWVGQDRRGARRESRWSGEESAVETLSRQCAGCGWPLEEAAHDGRARCPRPRARSTWPCCPAFRRRTGDLDGAMASLEKGYEARDGLMPWIGSWFDYGDLQNDPRFQDLLRTDEPRYVRGTVSAPGATNVTMGAWVPRSH